MGQIVNLTATDGHALTGYRADPAGSPRGALVIVQEIFGVNSHIRSVCDGYAADGYIAVAPALFDRIEPGLEFGYTPDDVAKGRELKGQAAWDDAVKDVAAAMAELAGIKTGVIGYCWGGSLAWLAATRIDGVSAAVGYYGGQIADYKDETAKCPVMLHFGTEDASIPMDNVESVIAANPDIAVHIYEGAGHGFNCDQRGSFDPEASATARERTLAFLAEHIG